MATHFKTTTTNSIFVNVLLQTLNNFLDKIIFTHKWSSNFGLKTKIYWRQSNLGHRIISFFLFFIKIR